MRFRLLANIFAVAGFIAILSSCSTIEVAGPKPLTGVHAHNDYVHARPLFDALDQGFCSVEADIFLIEGKLLVAHDHKDIDPSRTLESLYLTPLRKRVRHNGGHVYRNGPECTLLIDFKTDGKSTYAALRKVLEKYSDILTVYRDGKKETNAVSVILTGGYSRAALAADPVRYAAGDGLLGDLKTNPSPDLIPWISENWSQLFKWRGKGEFPEEEKQKLKEIVATAHKQGRRVRFWGSPDNAAFWTELLADGVDLINTDHLKGYQEFYNAR